MISDEAVEAAAKLIALEMGTPSSLTIYRHLARKALEAAAPHMLAECWERAYDDGFSDRNYGAGRRDNPYRSQA